MASLEYAVASLKIEELAFDLGIVLSNRIHLYDLEYVRP
jgi:hypothetical protein